MKHSTEVVTKTVAQNSVRLNHPPPPALLSKSWRGIFPAIAMVMLLFTGIVNAQNYGPITVTGPHNLMMTVAIEDLEAGTLRFTFDTDHTAMFVALYVGLQPLAAAAECEDYSTDDYVFLKNGNPPNSPHQSGFYDTTPGQEESPVVADGSEADREGRDAIRFVVGNTYCLRAASASGGSFSDWATLTFDREPQPAGGTNETNRAILPGVLNNITGGINSSIYRRIEQRQKEDGFWE